MPRSTTGTVAETAIAFESFDGQQAEQPVHPAVAQRVGRVAAGLEHVLAVEMRAVAIGRGDGVDEQGLARLIERGRPRPGSDAG